MDEDTTFRLSDIVTSLLESIINCYLFAITLVVTLVGNFCGLDMDNFSSLLIVSTGILFALMALSSIFRKTFKFLFSLGCASPAKHNVTVAGEASSYVAEVHICELRRSFLATAFLFLLLPSGFCATPTFSLQNTVFEQVGIEKRLDPALLYSIACVESAIASGKTDIRPHPWTLRTSKGPFYGKTKAEAEKELRRLLQKHRKLSIDIGMFQINSIWHGHRVKHLTDLLDPTTNVRVAADILNDCLKRYPKDGFRAIGAYHSSDKQKANRYARYVINIYSRLKEQE